MINSVVVTNPKGESIVLDLFHPEKTGIAIKKIDGLGPPKADISLNEISTTDQSTFANARLDPRDIEFDLALLEIPELNHSIENARHVVYKYFQLKKKAKILIYTDSRTLETEGYVESIEPDIFSKEESVTVSVNCPDPYLYDVNTRVVNASSIEPNFEFPFSNESLTDPLMEVGIIHREAIANLEYDGELDVGFTFVLKARKTLPSTGEIVLRSLENEEVMKLNLAILKSAMGGDIIAGDEIHVSTHLGRKNVEVYRDGIYKRAIGSVIRGSDWFVLTPGFNSFSYAVMTGTNNNTEFTDALNARFMYQSAYGGI